MADFDKAVALVFKHEGGFANDPDDTPTNWGITQGVYGEWKGHPVTVADVKAMTQAEAKEIYRQRYWAGIKGDAINSAEVAMYFLDMAVLRGVGAAVKTMQTILKVKADGIFGQLSVTALNAACKFEILPAFERACIQRFIEIVKANAAKLKFLGTWVFRTVEMSASLVQRC